MASDTSSVLAEDRPDAAASQAALQAEANAKFAQAVLDGLARPSRSLPSRFLYDERGSELFEDITRLKEYYPTRAETALLQTHGADIARHVGDADILVEFGSGSSRKTSLLINALKGLGTYIPIDVSETYLTEAAEWLAAQHDGLTIAPLIGDFTKIDALPETAQGHKVVGFFSGSTIGNLTREEANAFLRNAAHLLGQDSAFLVAIDLKKSPDILIPAYDDAEGVSAAFSLNLLTRINRELEGDFDIARFAHRAIYNEGQGRIEIYLESLTGQTVSVLGRDFAFSEGERIHTEFSHKYSLEGFRALAATAGWRGVTAWTDPDGLFSLHLLRFG